MTYTITSHEASRRRRPPDAGDETVTVWHFRTACNLGGGPYDSETEARVDAERHVMFCRECQARL